MPSQPQKNSGFDSDMAQRLLRAARQASENAYVPYSDFPVGAAVLTGDGKIVTGANIENASYGLTVCGERVAVFTAAAAGSSRDPGRGDQHPAPSRGDTMWSMPASPE